jgi:hypothetical protein
MIYDLMTYFMVGLQDLFSPVQLATPGVILIVLLFFSNASRLALAMFAAYFVGLFIIFNAIFDMGVVPFLWSSQPFLITASWFYCILGVLFLGVAWLFAMQWRLLIQDDQHPFAPWPRKFEFKIYLVGLAAFLLALGLSLQSNVWPQTLHIVLQGALSFTSGRLFDSIAGLVIYELVRNSLLIVLVVVMVMVYRGTLLERLKKNKSFIAIMLVAFYLAVGVGLIYFHFNRG